MTGKLTKTDIRQALKAAGNFRDAAEALGISLGTLSRRVKEFGIVAKSVGRPAAEITKKELKKYADGYTWKQAGEALGVSPSTVRTLFKKHGIRKIDRRNKGERYYCT